MSPIVREFRPRGKVTALLAFGSAVLCAMYGLFASGPLQILSLRFPPGTLALLTFLSLAVGVVVIRMSLGQEQCRRCRCSLERSFLTASPDALEKIIAAAEAGDAELLGDVSTRAVSESQVAANAGPVVVIDLGHCPRCRNVASLRARRVTNQVTAELTSEHVIVGPPVLRWIALAGASG